MGLFFTVKRMAFISCCLVLFLAVFNSEVNGFNYLDYANLFDGVVHLNSVKIAGNESWNSVDHSWKAWEFLGVRYASAERFQPPKFFDDYNSELHLEINPKSTFNHPGPACPQNSPAGSVFNEINKTSEDCLFLNIHLPPVYQEQTLLKLSLWPVLIFIHGGDFQGGAGNNVNGNELAREIDSIVITLNYRLGAFGFLSTEDYNAKGNWGLKDVIMGVKWIKEYIGRFGGDTSRIVLAGHASGGALVSLAMMDQDIREIVSGAIIMDGSSLNPKSLIDSPGKNAVNLATSAGCPVDDMEKMIACLRNLNSTELLRAANADKFKHVWAPTVDGDLIPYNPQWILRSSSWTFNGSILQGFTTRKSSSNKFVTEPNGNGSMGEIASSLHPIVSTILQCNVTIGVVEKVIRHYMKENPQINQTIEEEFVKNILLDLEKNLPIYQEAVEYATNPGLFSNSHNYQLFRLEINDVTSDLPENKSVSQIDMLFGRRDNHITEQLRHLVGTFVKQSRAFGMAFDLSNGHLLHLGMSKKWKIWEDSTIPKTVNFWDALSNACL